MAFTKLYVVLLFSCLHPIVSASPIVTEEASSTIIPSPNEFSSIEKRYDDVIPLISCDPPFLFATSYCLHNVDSQAYRIVCYIAGGRAGYFPWDLCPPNYLCVDGVPTWSPYNHALRPTAWCVHTEKFIKLAQIMVDPRNRQSETTVEYRPAANNRTRAVQAILTDPGGLKGKPANASTFSIDAQVSDKIAGVTSWRSTLDGADRCEHCSRVGLRTVPSDTQRIDLKVLLEAGVASALLYLVTVTS